MEYPLGFVVGVEVEVLVMLLLGPQFRLIW